MRFSENRRLACAVLVVCILGSIFGLGGASMARSRSRALDVFQNGTERQQTQRFSMDAYLDRSVECAQEMAYEAQLLLGDDNANAKKLLNLTDGFDAADIDQKYDRYGQMQSCSDLLYNEIYGSGIADAQRKNFKRAYDDFWGSDKFIQKDSYRGMASDFNDDLNGFPAGVVTKLWGIDKLNTFGG